MRAHLPNLVELHQFGKTEYASNAVTYLTSDGAEWTNGT